MYPEGKDELFTIIDFETTGLDPETEQITEVAALKIDKEGNEYGRVHTFVKLTNGRKPSEYAKVTEEECETGIDEHHAIDMLKKFIGNSTVVAQYAPFDFSYIAKSGFNPRHFICTRTLTHLVEPGENPSLGPTCERNGIEMLDAHRAMDDVLMTKEVFLWQKMKADKFIPSTTYRNVVVDFKKRPLRFTPVHATIIKES